MMVLRGFRISRRRTLVASKRGRVPKSPSMGASNLPGTIIVEAKLDVQGCAAE
jgi:hypothetical protein